MDFKSHARELATFLEKYTPIWSKEVLNSFPESIDDYPQDWINQLEQLTPYELYLLDCKKESEIPCEHFRIRELGDFRSFLHRLRELVAIPFAETQNMPTVLEAWAYQGVKKKKRHEIDQIIPQIINLKEKTGIEQIVDIGAGVGHLSRILAHYTATTTYSIDGNLEFQNIGKSRAQKYRKLPGAKDIVFINCQIPLTPIKSIEANNNKDDIRAVTQLKQLINNKTLTLGLHACGGLSPQLMDFTIHFQGPSLINFGCCYYKLNPDERGHMSDYFRQNNFPKLNLFALSLATRSHAEMSMSTYETKKRVKDYRYAFHLLLLEFYDIADRFDVGECPIAVYSRPFHEYAYMKLQELGLPIKHNSDQLEEFFFSSHIQNILKKMFLCNIVRWQLGRALEVYLTIDRCLYLEENGFEVSLKQYFKESLSPRNLGIIATKVKI